MTILNPFYMNNLNASQRHPLLQTVMNFIGKLRQNPDIYPIKYYKKSARFRRNWKSPEIK
ncbi:MAG: hypothetical protein ABIT96_03485 [Ferruginibacter sp.]